LCYDFNNDFDDILSIRLQLGRSAVEIANEKADGVLAAALARAREETATIAEEYASAAAELAIRDEELVHCRAQLELMTRACEQERSTSIGAAALASASAQRRAELEDENAQILESLINTKLQFAETAQRYEEDKKKVWTMKRRLQRYATRVASLEVAGTLRSQNFASPNRSQSIAAAQLPLHQQQPVQVRQPMQQSQSRLQAQPVRSSVASTTTTTGRQQLQLQPPKSANK